MVSWDSTEFRCRALSQMVLSIWIANVVSTSSRHAYEKTNIRLVELVPPAVKTNLGAGSDRSHDYGEPCDEFCAGVFKRFAAGELEIGYNASEKWRLASREQQEETAAAMTKGMQPPQFS